MVKHSGEFTRSRDKKKSSFLKRLKLEQWQDWRVGNKGGDYAIGKHGVSMDNRRAGFVEEGSLL